MSLGDYLKLLGGTSLPTILVVAGILFLLLSVIQQAGTIVVKDPKKEGLAIFIGIVLLVSGVVLYLIPLVQPITSTPTQTVSIPAQSETKTQVTVAPQVPAGISVIKIGMVTDTGGVDDKSFNFLSWQGVQEATTQLGIQGKYLESKQQSDYQTNIQQLLSEKDNLIITVGFLMGVDTATAAKANPSTDFAIVDYTYPDCSATPPNTEGKDCGSSTAMYNVQGSFFQTDQAAFLAGYLAAGMTKTGKVGTFGGVNIPPVTIYEVGFEAGVKYYNTKHNTNVQLLGWNSAKKDGLFTNNFTSTDDGNKFAQNLQQEGADIIMPVAGGVGLGSAAYCMDSKTCTIIGVDTDWFVSAPEYQSVELVSVQKKVDVAVFDAVKEVKYGTFKGGNVTYDLQSGGVDISPFHSFDSQIPQTLKNEITQAKQDLINGVITVNGVLGISQ
jgi:basic membrane protein A and related proteins